MRVAVGQAPSTTSITQNVDVAIRLVGLASVDGARLLLLSELFLNGYDIDAIASDPQKAGLNKSDERLLPLREACDRTGVDLLVGAALLRDSPSESGALLENVLLHVSGAGIRVAYSKLHLWQGEEKVFAGGSSPAVLNIDGLHLGLGICYDAGFPELSRLYARAGIDSLLFASAFAEGDEQHRYDIYHPARALESGAPLIVANALGRLSATFFGSSRIYDGFGWLVDDLGSTIGVVGIEITPRQADRNRTALPYLDDLLDTYEIAIVHHEPESHRP